jgi:hypothetical protein
MIQDPPSNYWAGYTTLSSHETEGFITVFTKPDHSNLFRDGSTSTPLYTPSKSLSHHYHPFTSQLLHLRPKCMHLSSPYVYYIHHQWDLRLYNHLNNISSFILLSVLRQVRSLFQIEISTKCDPVLPLSVSSTLVRTKNSQVQYYIIFSTLMFIALTSVSFLNSFTFNILRLCKLVEALPYKPEGRGFDSRWCNWNSSLTQSFRSHYGPGVDSASNRNEYQEYFLGVKAAGA